MPVTFAAAREEAKSLRRRVDLGGDPMGERHNDRSAPTVRDLALATSRSTLTRSVHGRGEGCDFVTPVTRVPNPTRTAVRVTDQEEDPRWP